MFRILNSDYIRMTVPRMGVEGSSGVIIGRQMKPLLTESLYVGRISVSMHLSLKPQFNHGEHGGHGENL